MYVHGSTRRALALLLTLVLLASPAVAAAADVTGEVIDQQGAGLAGMSVRAYEYNSSTGKVAVPAAFTTSTAGDGTYQLAGLDAAKHYVFAFVDPTAKHRDSLWDPFYFRGTHLQDSPYTPLGAEAAALPVNGLMPTAGALKAGRTYRIWGPDRYSNAIAVSKYNFPVGATDVVLASGATFADALSAAPLAGLEQAPILLTQPNKASSALINEIKRLGDEAGEPNPQIWIVGGKASVSDGVVNQLKAAGLTRFTRFAGADRYAVAASVATYVQARSTSAEPFLVRGDVFADALSVSPFAYMEARPILLTRPTAVPTPTKNAWKIMRAKAADTIIAVGGPASISNTVLGQLDAISGGKLALPNNGNPIYGADRYETGGAVVDFFREDRFDYVGGWDMIFLASGEVFPDALAGGAAAGYWYAPLVLTRGSSLSSAAKAVFTQSGPYVIDLQAMGGPVTLSSKAISSANSALGTRWYRIDSGGSVPMPTSSVGNAEVPLTFEASALHAGPETRPQRPGRLQAPPLRDSDGIAEWSR